MRSRAAWLGHGIALIDTNRADAGILISALYSDDPTPGSSCGTQRASKVPWTPQLPRLELFFVKNMAARVPDTHL
jgi:hypothetical protein